MPSRRKGKRLKSRRRKRRKTPDIPVVAAGYPLELEFKVNGLVEVAADGGETFAKVVPGEAVLEDTSGGVPGKTPDCVSRELLPEAISEAVEYMFMKPDTSSLFCTAQQNSVGDPVADPVADPVGDPVGHKKTASFEKISSGSGYSLWNSALFFKSWY